MTTSTAHGAPTLADVAGTIVLSAPQMGGAMLDAWLALAFPRIGRGDRTAAGPELTALSSRGLKLNPLLKDVREVSASLIAVKPQLRRWWCRRSRLCSHPTP